MLRRAGGAVERLEPTGPAVGLLAGLPFGVARTTLATGDTLLAYTDGVPDARNGADAPLGEARLLTIVAEQSRSPAALVAAIETEMAAHVAAAEQFDDVTLFALERASTSSTVQP
jgi:serine phosphatase RsbU (regulator of sigma subunit)